MRGHKMGPHCTRLEALRIKSKLNSLVLIHSFTVITGSICTNMTSNIRTFFAPRGPKSETPEKFPGSGQRLGSDTSTKEQTIDMPDQQTPAKPSKQASGQRMGGEYTHEGNIVKSNVLEGAGHQKFGQGLNIGSPNRLLNVYAVARLTDRKRWLRASLQS